MSANSIRIEARSQLLCLRCGHSEDEHNWQSGPCNHKDGHSAFYPFYETHCTCYAFVSKFKAMACAGFDDAALEATDGRPTDVHALTHQQWTIIFILLHAKGEL